MVPCNGCGCEGCATTTSGTPRRRILQCFLILFGAQAYRSHAAALWNFRLVWPDPKLKGKDGWIMKGLLQQQPFLEDHAPCSPQVLYWADWQVKTAQPAAKAYRKQAEKVMTHRRCCGQALQS